MSWGGLCLEVLSAACNAYFCRYRLRSPPVTRVFRWRATTRGASVDHMSKRLQLLLAAAALFSPAAALAQPGVASLLPETTVFAVHYSPEGVDTSTLTDLFADLDLERVTPIVDKLVALFEGAPALDELGGDVDPLEDLAGSCPDLTAALDEAAHALGPTAAGVSLSRFDPAPDLIVVTRPVDPGLADRIASAASDCLDGSLLGTQNGARLLLLADGTDMPLILTSSEGYLVVSTDPELVRGALRRLHGADDRGLDSTRIGALSGSMTARGFGMTLNLAAAADSLEMFAAMAPVGGDLVERLVTTLRVLGGFAWHASVDAGGVVMGSVEAFDARLAAEEGEDELLALFSCEGCDLGAPDLLPRDAVGLSGGVFSLTALVDWLDSWLDDAREAGLVDADVRGLVAMAFGVDLDEALLGWLGDSWHTAWLDVLATDVRPWLQGTPSVTVVPVTSEEEARRGVQLLMGALGDLAPFGDALADLLDAPVEARFDGLVAVRERSYRGVDYLRLRSGAFFDLGVAVMGGHLVLASPASSLHGVVDAYVGSYRQAGPAWRTYESLALEGTDVDGYSIVDVAAYLRGVAEITDLLAGPLATIGWLGAVGTGDEAVSPEALPTYDELIALVDVATEALELLASRTGVAIGTTELSGGARFSTWRLPLR